MNVNVRCGARNHGQHVGEVRLTGKMIEVRSLSFTGEEGSATVLRASGPDEVRRLLSEKELKVYMTWSMDVSELDEFLPYYFFCPRHGALELASDELVEALDGRRPAIAHPDQWAKRQLNTWGLD